MKVSLSYFCEDLSVAKFDFLDKKDYLSGLKSFVIGDLDTVVYYEKMQDCLLNGTLSVLFLQIWSFSDFPNYKLQYPTIETGANTQNF